MNRAVWQFNHNEQFVCGVNSFHLGNFWLTETTRLEETENCNISSFRLLLSLRHTCGAHTDMFGLNGQSLQWIGIISETEYEQMSDADRGTSLFVFVCYQFQQCRTTHYGKWVGTTACWIVGSQSFVCLHQIFPIFPLRLQTFLYHRLARLLFIVPLLTYSITVFSVSSYAPFN